jgi:hypothetical protein
MRLRNATPTEAPERPIAAGMTIGGWRVARVLPARDDRCTLVETAPRDGGRALLKVFTAPDDEVRRCVRSLGRARAGIDAPLLPILEVGEDGGMLYVAHPLVRGCTLAELLAEGPLDPAAAMTLIAQVAGGLETATLLGLAHGTLTPESIIVTTAKPRQALLADYGLPMPSGAACARAAAIQAADYCAPEAARGAPVEPASSVYALACILVECLTGAPPYPYERPLVTLHAQLVESPPRVSERRSGLPAALNEVVATALNKQAPQRHASPARFVRAAQKAFGIKAPVPVAVAARRYIDAAAAAVRRPTPAAKPARTPSRPVGEERKLAPTGRHPPARTRTRGATHVAPKTHRRRALWSAPALGLLMALLASTGGFATGHFTGGDQGAQPPARPAAGTAERAAYARDVDRVIQRLSAQRAAARRQLRAARGPAAQATQATALADAYRTARAALPANPGSGSLANPLAAAERAYRRLAAAATRRDARAFRAARADVVRREAELAAALARVQRA